MQDCVSRSIGRRGEELKKGHFQAWLAIPNLGLEVGGPHQSVGTYSIILDWLVRVLNPSTRPRCTTKTLEPINWVTDDFVSCDKLGSCQEPVWVRKHF